MISKYILDKYYLLKGSILVKHNVGTNGVDCWFSLKGSKPHHMCLSHKDFGILIQDVLKGIKYY